MLSFFKACVLLVLLSPGSALAHSPIKGLGDFFNGVIHPYLVPGQVLLVLSLGLLLGQHKLYENHQPIWFYLAALVIGLLANGLGVSLEVEALVLSVSCLIGLLVVIHRPLPFVVLAVCAALVGMLIGLDSSMQIFDEKARMIALFGSAVGGYFMLLYGAALSESLSHKPWQIVAVRVLASWQTASALMVLALVLRS